MDNFYLFSGTSNSSLAEKLAKKLGVPLGKIEIIRFPDGECRVRIEENVKGKTAYLLQSLSHPVDEHLFELCLMVDSAKRLGAKQIIAIIPWLSYQKQDREFRVGEAVSVEVIGKILSAIGLSKIIVFDLHSEIIKSYFKIPLIELSAREVLNRTLKKDVILKLSLSKLKNPQCFQNNQGDPSTRPPTGGLAQDDFVVISPDKGGKSRAEKFAKDYKLPIVYLQKTRDLETGKITYQQKLSCHSELISESKGMSKQVRHDAVKNKICVIFDDIVNRGGTVIKAAELLKQMGAKKVIVLATHGVLGGEAPKSLQNSKVNKIYLTDTIFIPQEKQFPKLKIVSVVEILSKVL